MTALATSPADRCLSTALELAAAGYALVPVVLELRPDGDKRCTFPYDDNGNRLRPSADADQIRAWWVDDPRRSFAVDVHTSGVEVVDLDVGPGGDAVGERSWGDLPRGAMRVRTRSGGWQFYFRRRPDGVALGNSAGRMPKVDTRGAVNDMAFAPGAWLINAPEQVYAVAGAIVSPEHLAPVPDIVVDAVGIPVEKREAATASTGDVFASPSEHSGVFTPDQALVYCRHVVARLAACAPDGKYTALIAAARSLGKFDHLGVKEWLWERCREALATSAVPVKDWSHARKGFDDSWANAIKAGDRAQVVDARSNPFDPPSHDPSHSGPTQVGASLLVDLTPYLDDDYEPETAGVGLERDDGPRLLYAGKWSTLIGETGIGKSWLALWHCVEEMRRGNIVLYAHFEEATPRSTVLRLRQLGMTPQEITARFRWLDGAQRPSGAALAAMLAEMPDAPTLAVLDGVNAACGAYDWDPLAVDGVNAYRRTLVAPLTAVGVAVLSVGHPPKARAAQGERHGYGSSAWLDLVDGVGFRVRQSTRPIRPGMDGYITLFSVKDRAGGVERHGRPEPGDEGVWTYLGAFHVMPPQSELGNVWCRLSSPAALDQEAEAGDELELTDDVRRFRWLARQGVKVTAGIKTIARSLREAPKGSVGPTNSQAIDELLRRRYAQWWTDCGEEWLATLGETEVSRSVPRPSHLSGTWDESGTKINGTEETPCSDDPFCRPT